MNNLPTNCATCDHTIDDHDVTLWQDQKTVFAKCRVCKCDGVLYAE